MLNLGVNTPAQTKKIELPRHDSLQAMQGYNSDNTPYWLCRVYNGTGGALVANRPYLITFAGTSTTVQNPRVTALAAVTGVQNHVVIAHEAIADGAWGWVCFQGYHDCGVEGTTDVAAGDYLLVSAGVSTTGLVKDGTSRTQQSCAIALEAQASNSVVDKRVYLFGGPALTSLAQSFGATTFSSTVTFGTNSTINAPANGSTDFTITPGATSTGSIRLAVAAGQAVRPDVSGQGLLGFGSARWSGIFANNANFNATVTMEDNNIALGTTTGTKIGTATSQKLGFWNATPVIQQSGGTQTFSTAESTHAARTALALTDNTAGTANTTLQALADGTTYANDVAAIRNNFADLAASNNAIIADLADTAAYLNFVVDQLQVLGLLA